MVVGLCLPYERKGRVNNAYLLCIIVTDFCVLLLLISAHACYRFLCTGFTIFCALVVSVYTAQTSAQYILQSGLPSEGCSSLKTAMSRLLMSTFPVNFCGLPLLPLFGPR